MVIHFDTSRTPQILPYESLLFTDFILYLFHVINHNCEYDSFLWVLQTHSELPKQGVVLEIPTNL